MKKRLLSAALALAMVLTLLPATAVPAFAANTYTKVTSVTGTDAEGKNFIYQASTDYSNPTVTKEAGKWYYTAPADAAGNINIYEVDSTGFIMGVSTSGAWYSSESSYRTKNPGATTFPNSFTLLEDLSLASITLKKPTSLNVDVNGKTLTLPDLEKCGTDDVSAMTSVTVNDKLHPTSYGAVSGLTTARTAYNVKATSGLTLNATNVSVGSINLAGRGNNVTLTNCTATAITMNGTSNDASNKVSYAGQQLRTIGGTVVNGAVAITGDSSTVNLQDTTGTGNTVTLESNGGSLTVGGSSNIGAVTVKNNQQSAAAINGAVPSVTVNGGTVAGISNTGSSTTASSTITINRTTNDINISGAISTNKGTVSITQANTQAITVGSGSLSIAGSKINIGGKATLGGVGVTNLSITATDSTFAGFEVASGKEGNLNITGWPAGRVNNYGTLTLNDYTGKGIKGGIFSATTGTELGKEENMNWVDNANLQFIVKVKGGKGDVALYGRDELTQAISDIAKGSPAQTGDIVVLGQGEAAAGKEKYIQLNFGGNPWAYIQYSATTGIKLPTRINNTGISKWIVQNDSNMAQGASFDAGVEKNIPLPGGKDNNLILDSTDTTAEVTSITNVTQSASSTVNNQNIRVALEGNTIRLSGAIVPAAGGIASVYVNLATDVVKPDGQLLTIENVVIDYDVNKKTVSFNEIQPSLEAYGVIVQEGALVLNRGTGARYTVTASLSESAASLGLYAPNVGSPIVVTVGGKLSGWSKEAKKQLVDQMEKDGKFIFDDGTNQNRAMLEAINAAQATITSDNSVSTWIANARDYIWKNGSPKAALSLGKHTGSWKDFANVGNAQTDYQKVESNYNKAYIVPYLVVNITDYNSASNTMTATLTPYYRVDVSASASYDAEAAHTVQAGRALSALTGDMTNPIKVDLGLGTGFDSQKMHQDGKYVYTGSNGEWSIYHAGTNGLGSIEINGVDGLISMESTIDNRWGSSVQDCPWKFDSLQAAVDDTRPGKTQQNADNATPKPAETMDTIVVDGRYKGSCDFTMTGYARKIKVRALGDLPINCTSQNVDKLIPSGYTYTFQLKRDTAPTGGNITIASATGGTASVSANPAKAGQTVTVSLSASAGYTPSGVSVKTSSGAAVSVSGSGSSYTFTMPSGSVTVTPSFTQTQQQQKATVSVSSTGMGTAVTSAGSNQVAPGTTVTVTVAPKSGYRSMGVSVTGASASRTGKDQFRFTVPSGYTSVTVTPSFDVDTGNSFSDVWSTGYTSYCAPAVTWAVNNGITKGTSDWTFGPSESCTRGQIVTFLYRAAGSPAVGSVANPFWDVTPGDYYNAILWAVKNGITKGKSDNYFGVNDTVTRAEAVTFMYRAKGSPAASTSSGFYDVPANEYYARAVTWAKNTGVTVGNTDGTFGPNSPCERGHIVTFLYRDRT